jgi:hypothetical protein
MEGLAGVQRLEVDLGRIGDDKATGPFDEPSVLVRQPAALLARLPGEVAADQDYNQENGIKEAAQHVAPVP